MKKLLSLALVLAMIASLFAAFPAYAATSGTCGDKLTWTLDDNGTLTISGTGAMKDWSWGFGHYAPWYSIRGSINTVVINDGVTTIGSSAFSECTSLTSVVIGDSVTTIGQLAFDGCTSLMSITIPDSVTTIGYAAFYVCTSLTSVIIPDSVTTIGDSAFRYCSSLTSIAIPDSVTSIGERAFWDCTSLTSITVDKNNEYYCSVDGNLFSKDKKTLVQYAIGKTSASYTIPDSVTTIGDSAFRYRSSLTSIAIPDSVTSIGDWAFSYCTSLTSITIPDSVTSIDVGAFYDCTSLTDVYYGGSRDDRKKISIGSSNTPLTNATWHYNYVTYDNEFTYTVTSNKAKITGYTGSIGGEVTIPATIDGYTVNRIGSNAFSKCKGITSVVIPDGVTTINTGAFANCANLKEVTLPKALKTVGKNAFKNTAIETVNYKGGTSAWAIIDFTSGNDALTEAFSGGADSVTFRTVGVILSFTKVNITGCDGGVSGELVIPATVDGKKVAKIASRAFYGEINLTSLVIENGITAIKNGAFRGCLSLSAVTIPKSVKTIEGSAFFDCPITDVYYGGSEADWNKMTICNGNTALTNANIHFAE